MSAYKASNSHDPKTDHRSLVILVIAALAGLIGLAVWAGAFEPTSEEPTFLYSADGCDVYRFVDESETGHFVRCANGKASTSVKGKHVITEPKNVGTFVKPAAKHTFYRDAPPKPPTPKAT